MPTDTLTRITQKQIIETWTKLPEHEKKHLQQEETTRRRHELREAKINIWKKWRKADKNREASTKAYPKEDKDKEWLERLEDTLDKLKREDESRKETRTLNEKRRKSLLAEKKTKQEEMLSKDQERKDRKIKQNMLGRRWEMMKWVTKYIDENSDKWEKEKTDRKMNEEKDPRLG